MEQSTQPKPWIGLFIGIFLAIVLGIIVTLIIFHYVLGISSNYVPSLQMLVVLPILYPFLKRFPTKPGRKPLSFSR